MVNSSVSVNIEGGFKDDGYGGKASQRHKGHEQVGGGEEGPGLHGVVSNCKYYSTFLTKGKVRQTGLKGTVNRPGE